MNASTLVEGEGVLVLTGASKASLAYELMSGPEFYFDTSIEYKQPLVITATPTDSQSAVE